MPYRANYPASVAEVRDPAMKFRPAGLRAVRRLAAARPFRRSARRRVKLLQRCLGELAAAYGIRRPHLYATALDGSRSIDSSYSRERHTIVLRGRVSVLTFLHEFGHARGMDERQACRFSINLFARCFPRSFARLRPVGHMLVRGA